jgi:5-methylcytosine-specific restriction endonuclease McrA
MAIVACSESNCERTVQSRGLCSKHYKAAHRAGLLEKHPTRARKSVALCSIDGCERDAWARGWCGTHYARWRKTGSLETTRFNKRPCSVAACTNDAGTRGWCDTHYGRWKSTGDVREKQPIAKAKSPVIEGRKMCNRCSEWLSLNDFNTHRHGTGGVSSTCRECQRQHSAKWRSKNRDYWSAWQKANPEKVLAITHKRRAQKLSREHEVIDRMAVFVADNFTCKLCGDPLDMTAKFPHPLSPSIDHVIPLNKGGHHLYSNIQSAHFVCNSAKGDRLPQIS